EGCDACQAALERLRRMAASWMSDPVAAGDTDDVVAIAAARFHARTARHAKEPTFRGFMPFAAAGAAAALVLLVATHKVGPSRAPSVVSGTAGAVAPAMEPRVTPPDLAPPPAGTPAAGAAPAAPHGEGPRGVTPPVDGPRLQPPAGAP